MVPRGVSKSEFKRLTVDEYLRGDYGVTREVAEELAEVEWQIRQKVEGMRRLPSGVRKQSNPRAGFGLKGIWLGEKEKKPQPQPSEKLIVVSSMAFKALRSKGALSPADVSWLFSGETEFLFKYARPLGFPSFEPRIKGYRTWRVYEWLGLHAKHGKIKVRA